MKVLGVDFEATGKEPDKARVIEIGAILWESPGYQERKRFSTLVYAPDYPLLDSDVQRITKLTDKDLLENGISPKIALTKLTELLEEVDMVIAHNKGYDETVYKRECERNAVTQSLSPWFCTLEDVSYPEWQRCKQLSHLALDHGITVDPSTLHRAVNDVELMGELLRIGGYAPENIRSFAIEPWVYMRAVVPEPWKDGGMGKDAARKAGYGWETVKGSTEPKFPKWWVKRVKESQLEKEKSLQVSFKREIVVPGV